MVPKFSAAAPGAAEIADPRHVPLPFLAHFMSKPRTLISDLAKKFGRENGNGVEKL